MPGSIIPNDDGDSYLAPAASALAEIREQGSRFLAYAVPVRSADETQRALEDIRARHHAATHHCWAWRMGIDREQVRFSDDGEPSGTAGRRILAAIDRASLSDILVVVVRYFGGVKLGVGGLARAYFDASEAVLRELPASRRYLLVRYRISFPYDQTSQVHHVLELAGAAILERAWGDAVRYDITIRRSRADALVTALTDATGRTIRIELPDGPADP